MEQRGQRLVFLDVLRLIATVQMIQGHAIDAVLAPSYRSGSAFAVWTFVRGLTSVLFLFSAGYSFALAEAKNGFSARRVRRAAMLIALGYLMHAPFALLFGAPREATLQAALEVDVLQCIGVSLLMLELLAWMCEGWQRRVELAVAAAMLAFLLTPLAATSRAEGPLRALENYFTSAGGSLFPLLPWSGYVFAGFASGAVLSTRPALVSRVLAGVGLGVLLIGVWWVLTFPAYPPPLRPGYFLVKLACVLLLAGALARLRLQKLPAWLSRLAGETLFLYVSHVVVLYADVIGVQATLGRQHSPWFGLALAAALLLTCGAAALAWRSLRGPRQGGTRAPQTP